MGDWLRSKRIRVVFTQRRPHLLRILGVGVFTFCGYFGFLCLASGVELLQKIKGCYKNSINIFSEVSHWGGGREIQSLEIVEAQSCEGMHTWEPLWCVKVGNKHRVLPLLRGNKLRSICVPTSPVWWWNESTL